MIARPNFHEGIVASVLVASSFAVMLAAGNEALGADPLSPAALHPAPVRVTSVQPKDVAPAEAVPAPERKQVLPGLDDAEVISRVVGRTKLEMPPSSQLDVGEALGHGTGTTRPWGMSVSAWEAPAFCHRPLYFEDENLERHGRSLGLLQPAASAAHFAGRTLAWPYLAGAYPPHECVYTLGRERPGSCAAYRLYRPPVSVRGAIYEGAAAAGLSFIVP
jgi:hypothetical protein